MKQNGEELLRQFVLLTDEFSQLSVLLSEAANALQQDGMPPSESLLEELATARQKFVAFRDEVCEVATSLAVPLISSANEMTSLSELDPLIGSITEVEEKRVAALQMRQQAVDVLEHVLMLSHRNKPNFQPLQDCQAKARELLKSISDLSLSEVDSSVESLATGSHSFSDLLCLIENGEDLEDERWDQLQESITKAFGRKLAIAATRGRLEVDAKTSSNEVVKDVNPETKHVSAPPVEPTQELQLDTEQIELTSSPVEAELLVEAEASEEFEQPESLVEAELEVEVQASERFEQSESEIEPKSEAEVAEETEHVSAPPVEPTPELQLDTEQVELTSPLVEAEASEQFGQSESEIEAESEAETTEQFEQFGQLEQPSAEVESESLPSAEAAEEFEQPSAEVESESLPSAEAAEELEQPSAEVESESLPSAEAAQQFEPPSAEVESESLVEAEAVQQFEPPSAEVEPESLVEAETAQQFEPPSAEVESESLVEAETAQQFEPPSAKVESESLVEAETAQQFEPPSAEVESESLVEAEAAQQFEQPEPEVELAQDVKTDTETAAYFPFGESAQSMAQSILGAPVEQQPLALHDLVWRLVFEDRLDLAYHLARCLEDQFPSLQPHLPSWLIHSILLAQHVRHEEGQIEDLLYKNFSPFNDDCFVDGNEEWNSAIGFLLAAASLRPALLGNSGATTILRAVRINEPLAEFYEYHQTIARYREQNYPLDLYLLNKVNDQATWQAEIDDLSQKAAEWWHDSSQMGFRYAPATKAWNKSRQPNGLIYSLLIPIIEKNGDALTQVEQGFERLANETRIRREVQSTRRGNFAARPLNRLISRMQEPLELVRRWVDLQEFRLEQGQDFRQQQAQQLRAQIWDRQEAVLAELNGLKERTSSLLILSGLSCCVRAISNIGRLFDPEVELPLGEPEPKHIVHAELLKITGLSLDEEWQPKVTSELNRGLLELIANEPLDWKQAFEARKEAREHEATGRIIEYLEATAPTSFDFDMLYQRRKHIEECRAALERDIEETNKEVEKAVTFGSIEASAGNEYSTEIAEIENALMTTLRFRERRDKLRAIRNEIEDKRAAQIKKIEEKMSKADITPQHPAHKRIRSVLDKNDIFTANEYIGMVLQGQPIPESSDAGDIFVDFFPDTAHKIENFREHEGRSDRAAIRKVERRENFGGVAMRPVAGAQAGEAAEMLKAWFGVKRAQKINENAVKNILTPLGFITEQVEVEESENYTRQTWVNVRTKPIRGKDQSPVAFYGSLAKGRYRILCVWGRPTEDNILNNVGQTYHRAPVLVFYFGRMSETRRRELAFLCRIRQRTFIVIDETLILYLCGQRGSRLPVLFECALPFCFLELYTPTAGLVPPEIFYGRTQERNSIIDRMGSCFIYGGRQLGKTALLRDVERTFHAPDEGRIALWLDLKAVGIGYYRHIDEFWPLLATELNHMSVLPANLPADTSEDQILHYIRQWLEENVQRRILLLLDEADRFLEFDGQQKFPRVARLKGLMDRTERRFKVVFAGLHNVQRTTRVSNNPLAHYGKPICIGPLLHNGEWREARALIERPLASLGYRFESPDLVTRILSRTNYYPSLIQLYCTYLLRELNSKVELFDLESSPPYVIDSKHVDDVYDNQDLRKDIRDRFRWTLDLDSRYHIIALLMALESRRQDGDWVDSGFSVAWIREQALAWWPEGFEESAAEDYLPTLLDEMVGLGVLRVANEGHNALRNPNEGHYALRNPNEGHYALRNPNVISLIGTEEEIEHDLLKDREEPLEYEPVAFAFPDDVSRRSPLTVQQESKLQSRQNGTSIIFGCRAAGLDDLVPSLKRAFKSELFTHVDCLNDGGSFAEELDALSKRTKNGTTLLLVSATCPWDEKWIDQSIQTLNQRESETSFLRVVFVADPSKTWFLLNQDIDRVEKLISKGVTAFTLKPWSNAAVRQWLEAVHLPINKQGRKNLAQITGNWPLLLQRFYQDAHNARSHWEDCLSELENLLNNRQYLRELVGQWGVLQEVDQVLRALAILGDASTDDLVELVEPLSAELVEQSCRCAELLSLVHLEEDNRWHMDPLVGRLLLTLEE